MDFNKLTLKSQEAVAAAGELARRRGNPEVYPEHLLLALLDQELPQQLVDDPAELRAWLRDGRIWMLTTNFPQRALELRRELARAGGPGAGPAPGPAVRP